MSKPQAPAPQPPSKAGPTVPPNKPSAQAAPAKPAVPVAAKAEAAQDQTVSLTFKNQATGKNTLQIIAAVTPEDREKLVADPTGQLVAKYVIGKVMQKLAAQQTKTEQ